MMFPCLRIFIKLEKCRNKESIFMRNFGYEI